MDVGTALNMINLLAEVRGGFRANDKTPDDVLAAIDANARRAGLSRTRYIRRPLSREGNNTTQDVRVDDLVDFAHTFADRGQHRAVSIPDLLVAATAELDNSPSSTWTRTSSSWCESPGKQSSGSRQLTGSS